MDGDAAGGTLLTKPLSFSGRHLFINAKADRGKIAVEALDPAGQVIPPFTIANCRSVHADATRQRVSWKGAGDLSGLRERAVRFRFHVAGAELFSFWVTPDRAGASYGFVAAGGPGFNGAKDTTAA